MKIALTGASGYLGSTFIKEYRELHDITAIGRGELHIDGVKCLKSDYNAESLRTVLSGCDAVAHLAYQMATKDNEQAGMEAYRSSMEATRNVFETAMSLGINNMVFASSRLVYPSRSDEPFTEESPVCPVTSYGKSKVMMEELCEELNQKGACIKVLRFGQIIGADMKVRGMFQIFMEKALRNEPLTLIGSDVRDYVCVKDTCRAIMAAVEHPEAAGIFNISMGVGTDNRAMAEGIISATGSSSEIVLAETDNAKIPDRIVLDCSKAKSELGFTCVYDTVFSIAQLVAKSNDQSKREG